MKDLFLPEITGTLNVLKFLVYVTKEIGVYFHLNTPFSDYIDIDGNPAYTEMEARLLQDKLAECSLYYDAMYNNPDLHAEVEKARKFGTFQASHRIVTDKDKIISFLHANATSTPAPLPFALHVYTADLWIEEPKEGKYSVQVENWGDSGTLEEMEYVIYDWSTL